MMLPDAIVHQQLDASLQQRFFWPGIASFKLLQITLFMQHQGLSMAPQRAVSCAKGTNPSFDRRHMRYVHLSILRITENL